MSKVLEELEEYVDFIDADCNTIENFDMGCCDEREVEVLRNVFNYLDKLIKKHKDG